MAVPKGPSQASTLREKLLKAQLMKKLAPFREEAARKKREAEEAGAGAAGGRAGESLG